jgi:ABC-type multidrug transport system fused ATPase/permease subunit
MMWGGPGGRGLSLGGTFGPGSESSGMARMALASSESDFGKAFDAKIFKRMWTYMSPYKLRVFVSIVLLIIYTGTLILYPLIPGLAINAIIQNQPAHFALACVFFIINNVVMWLAQYQQQYQMTWVGQHALYRISSAMFRHISKLPMEFFDQNETGRVMARMQNDVTVLQQVLSSGTLTIMGSVLSLSGIFVSIMLLNWKLGLMVFVTAPIMGFGLWIWQRQSRPSFLAARAAISAVNASIQENVSGIRVIQSLSRERRNAKEFDEVNAHNLGSNLTVSRLSALVQPMVELIAASAMSIAVLAGGLMVLNGSLKVGFLFSFVLYTNRFFDPIRDATQQYINLQRATVAAERIFEILDTPITVEEKADAVPLVVTEGRVEYRDVHFEYVPGTEVLHGLNLSIRPGERLAIVGQTGAGKSTLISLLARFYEVTTGGVLIDGQDVRDVTFKSLRQSLGIVLQDPFLFSGTVRENIAYGRPDATDDEVEAAARGVNAHDMIARLPQGYNTPVRPNSSNLSTGQRQLISLARALLISPKILCLDEATAGIDPHTEAILQQGIARLLEGRTAIVIAHRLSTIRNADRIIVMDQGRIVEEGNHDQLMRHGGIYYTLSTMGFRDADESADAVAANA